MKGIELVVLDFDGVIVESNGVKDKVFENIFNRFGKQGAEALAWHREHISLSRYAKFDFLLKQLGREGDEQLRNELVYEFSKTTLDLMKDVVFVKGAMDFLQHWYKQIPLYLASVTPEEYLTVILENLDIRSFFRDVYGCPPWTKAGAIMAILEKENILPSAAVLIGDSYGDQRAARETGIQFIGRNSGLGFEDPQPDHVVRDLHELSAWFEN